MCLIVDCCKKMAVEEKKGMTDCPGRKHVAGSRSDGDEETNRAVASLMRVVAYQQPTHMLRRSGGNCIKRLGKSGRCEVWTWRGLGTKQRLPRRAGAGAD